MASWFALTHCYARSGMIENLDCGTIRDEEIEVAMKALKTVLSFSQGKAPYNPTS